MMTDSAVSATNDDHEFVAFRVGSQEFCVDIMCVREIRGWTVATPLPHAPDFVRGVINLRGAVLPIVDLASRFGLPDTEPTPRSVIIVVQINKQVVGLLVDAVSDIFTTTGSSWQATPEIASDTVKSMVGGIHALDGRMISLVVLNSIIPTAEKAAA